MTSDRFADFKAQQRQGWGLFSPLAAFTTPPAARLIEFAEIRSDQMVLDVACGTGVATVTAARRGASVTGLDLSPVLLQEAHANAELAEVAIAFDEGDVESLPYPDASFDVVISQFGHMFAPQPEVALGEMLRVLKVGGRIAFSTWPPELMIGQVFALVAQYMPPPEGVAPPPAWGDIGVVRARLGDAVTDIEFDRAEMTITALSPQHYRAHMEQTAAPVARLTEILAQQPERLSEFRHKLDALTSRWFSGNEVQQSFLMTRAIKA